MNEKIRELARSVQCERNWTEEDIEKFAELIVKECMELGDKALQDGKWPGDVLKEHFGVE